MKDGTYTENVNVNKDRLSIQSENGAVIVGHSSITVVDEKIKFQHGITYGLLAGNYECERAT